MTPHKGSLMKIVSLNVNGFGGNPEKLALKRLICREEPYIFLFQKTMTNGDKVIEHLNSLLKE